MRRSVNRPCRRAGCRAKTRSLNRGRCRCDYIAQALLAFRRAIRAHRRLMKLAPRLYDYGIADAEFQGRIAERARWEEWEPILAKVYGQTAPGENHGGCNNGATMVQKPPILLTREEALPLSPRLRRLIELEETNWQAWIQAASQAMKLSRQQQPHKLIPLGQMVRLLDIAFTLKRLCCGLETNYQPPPPIPCGELTSDEALKKIYGNSPNET